MSERATVARPYAEAAFGLARDESRRSFWSRSLALGTLLVQDPAVADLARDPRVAPAALLALFRDLGAAAFDDEIGAFLGLLIENERLLLLPEIAVMFEALRRDADRVIDVRVTSAYSLTASEEGEIRERLERRFQRKVVLTTLIDPALIAGAVIRADDQVIDGSLRARLASLAAHLTS
ncbi:MAG: F0F1 ATP synthase subunit delta [Acidiferrobacteraceae bacterium]